MSTGDGPPDTNALSQLGGVIKSLSGIPGNAYEQLQSAAVALAEYFGVPFVSIAVISPTAITATHMAAAGRLARMCTIGLPQFLDASNATSLYRVVSQQRTLRLCSPLALPPDWAVLQEEAGLHGFMAAPITLGSDVVGVVTLAEEQAGRIASAAWWQTALELLSAWVSTLFRDRLLVSYASIGEELLGVDSLDDLIRTLSRCLVRLQSGLLRQARLACRVACVRADASSAIIFDENVLRLGAVPEQHVGDASMHAGRRTLGGAGGPGIRSHRSSTTSIVCADGCMVPGVMGQQAMNASSPAGGMEGSGAASPALRMQQRMSLLAPCSPFTSPSGLPSGVYGPANLVLDPPPAPPVGSLPSPGIRLLDSAVPDRPGSAAHATQQLPPSFLRQSLPLVAGAEASPVPVPAPADVAGPSNPLLKASVAVALSPRVQAVGPWPGGMAGTSGLLVGSAPQQPVAWPGMQAGGGGGCGSLTGDTMREGLLWGAMDPGLGSNVSAAMIQQVQAQVEGQSYMLERTLLAEAIRNRAGVWVGDCVAFMQNPDNPSADVFLATAMNHTALALAVMWERAGAGCAAVAAAAAARPRCSTPQRRRSSHVTVRTSSVTADSAGTNVTGVSLGLQRSALTSALAIIADRGAAGGGGGGAAGGGGGGGAGAAGTVTGLVSPQLGRQQDAARRDRDVPLLAVYLLTSGVSSPALLEELLVNVRELLLFLEPLVAMKLREDLAEEWDYLQAEVLDRSKIQGQPKGRTLVLQRSQQQQGLDSNANSLMDSLCGELGPGASGAQHALPSNPDGTRPPSRQPTGGQGSGQLHPGAGSAGPAGGGAGTGEALRSHVEGLRLGSDRAPASPRGGRGAGPHTLLGRTPSFTISASFSSKRMSALISGVQDRVQQAQRMSMTYATMFNRPDDLRSIQIVEKIGSGGFGTVYLGVYQSTEVAVKVILERESEAEVLRNAVELAVMSTLSHPNIVQVLTFFTDVTVQHPPAALLATGTVPPITLLPPNNHITTPAMTPAEAPQSPMPAHRAARSEAPASRTHSCSACSEPEPEAEREAEATAHLGMPSLAPTLHPHQRNPLRVLQRMPSARAATGGVAGSPGRLATVGAAGTEWIGVLQQREREREAAEAAAAAVAAAAALGSPSSTKKALVIVMEFCDGGCLQDAIRGGAFKERLKGRYGATAPAWGPIYLTLLEVAMALRYLHAINLVHRDLKPQNVLLKSSPSDVRGFTAKLSDFGLVKLLTEQDAATAAAQAAVAAQAAATERTRRRRYSGTITHVAPEAILTGAAVSVDAAADVYAFGILVWEMVTGQPVYLGLNSDQIAERVVRTNLRPEFPPDTPAEVVGLAARCWDAEPRRRPAAEELVQTLSMLSSSTRGASMAAMAARRRLSTLSHKELMLRREASANAAAQAAAGILGLGCGTLAGAAQIGVQRMPQGHGQSGRFERAPTDSEFPLHIL